MYTIVQLSYNINEKLRLDDRTFSGFEAHSTELQGRTSVSTSFSKTEPSDQRPTSYITATDVTSSSTSISSFGGGVHDSITSQLGTRLDKISPMCRSETTPSTLPKTKHVSETSVFKLHDSSFQRKSSFSFQQEDKVHAFKSSTDSTRCTSFNSSNAPNTGAFPSLGLVGQSCTLHLPKHLTAPSGSSVSFSDVPPSKKHCRSVSELNESRLSASSSPWKPPMQSHVWMPFRNSKFSVCSKSFDYTNFRSKESCFGGSHFTPPSSPVPRPASVTVIKQESGAWTFLSSQKVLTKQDQSTSFSPDPSSHFMSPLSRLNGNDAANKSHSGLSATKRSLSFSADFDHRESIEYTPASTPELSKRFDHDVKRFGGLSRCRSHPSGLNMKRSKSRRRSRLLHNRPTLDFAKMKQTAILTNQQNHYDNLNRSTKDGFSVTSDLNKLLSVNPVFPSAVMKVHSTKINKLKCLEPIRSNSPVVSFSVGYSRPLSDIQHRIPSPADEATDEHDDEYIPNLENPDTARDSANFIPECPGLNVDDIENEIDD